MKRSSNIFVAFSFVSIYSSDKLASNFNRLAHLAVQASGVLWEPFRRAVGPGSALLRCGRVGDVGGRHDRAWKEVRPCKNATWHRIRASRIEITFRIEAEKYESKESAEKAEVCSSPDISEPRPHELKGGF